MFARGGQREGDTPSHRHTVTRDREKYLRAEGVKKPSHRPKALFTEGLCVSGLIQGMIPGDKGDPGGGGGRIH